MAFLTPLRRPKLPSPASLPAGNRCWVAGPVGRVSVIHVGRGPAVLLVHGWEGQPADFAFVVPCLLQAGFSVIALDLPAHGASDGTMASIPVCATSLLRIQRVSGALHAVIGHSVGSLIAVHAAEMGLQAARMVLISSTARYEVYARSYASYAGLNATETEEMIQVLESMDVNVRGTSIPEIAPRLSQKALFIHSKDDHIVPIGDAVESAMAWPGASLLLFESLGHRRILRASLVHQAILKFISD